MFSLFNLLSLVITFWHTGSLVWLLVLVTFEILWLHFRRYIISTCIKVWCWRSIPWYKCRQWHGWADTETTTNFWPFKLCCSGRCSVAAGAWKIPISQWIWSMIGSYKLQYPRLKRLLFLKHEELLWLTWDALLIWWYDCLNWRCWGRCMLDCCCRAAAFAWFRYNRICMLRWFERSDSSSGCIHRRRANIIFR